MKIFGNKMRFLKPDGIRQIILFFLLLFIITVKVSSQGWRQKPLHKFTPREYEMTLDFWKEKYRDRLDAERITSITEGADVFLLKITDKSISNENKRFAQISAPNLRFSK